MSASPIRLGLDPYWVYSVPQAYIAWRAFLLEETLNLDVYYFVGDVSLKALNRYKGLKP